VNAAISLFAAARRWAGLKEWRALTGRHGAASAWEEGRFSLDPLSIACGLMVRRWRGASHRFLCVAGTALLLAATCLLGQYPAIAAARQACGIQVVAGVSACRLSWAVLKR